jgi:hypothetical protein
MVLREGLDQKVPPEKLGQPGLLVQPGHLDRMESVLLVELDRLVSVVLLGRLVLLDRLGRLEELDLVDLLDQLV